MEEFLKTVGLIGIIIIIFAETGLLIGFFLPGDSLLFTAGFLASQGVFPIVPLVIGCFIAAIVGDSTGYMMGKRWGRKLFQHEESLLFKKKYLLNAQAFYERHGAKTIVLARFIPIVRTFAPIVAGIADMNYSRFMTYNVVGAVIWAIGATMLGYFLGTLVPHDQFEHYLLVFLTAFFIITTLPTVWHLLRDPDSRAAIKRYTRIALAKVGIGRAPKEKQEEVG